jgi:ADP-heptose:LPS heptosyltransferase
MQKNKHIYSHLKLLKTELAWLVRNSIDSLVAITPKQPIYHVSQKKHLLIVKTDAIGDFIIFTGILPYFRELYPISDWQITLLGSKENTKLSDFVKSDIISSKSVFDNFIAIDRLAFTRNLIYRFEFQKFLQNLSYDLVIYPVYSRSRNADKLISIINAPEKISIDGDCRNIPLNLKLKNNQTTYTKVINLEESYLSEVEKNVSFIQKLGIKTSIDGVPRWKIPPKMLIKYAEIIKSKGIESNFAVVCPGASANYRIWTPHKVAETIDYLWNEYKLAVLICGSSQDKSISLKIQNNLKSAKVACLCGETNLVELSAIMSCATLCITMDSGPAHLAVAVNAPLICIIGGGDYKRFFPYGDPKRFRAATEELDCFYCDWRCKFNKPICVENISVKTITKEIDELMNIVLRGIV